MARWLGFQDNTGRKRPREGAGSVEDVASHKPQVVAALASTAAGIARRADMNLDVRPRVRTGASKIRLEQGKLDYYVMLVDESHGSAYGIEKRHGVLRDSMPRK